MSMYVELANSICISIAHMIAIIFLFIQVVAFLLLPENVGVTFSKNHWENTRDKRQAIQALAKAKIRFCTAKLL